MRPDCWGKACGECQDIKTCTCGSCWHDCDGCWEGVDPSKVKDPAANLHAGRPWAVKV